MGDVTLFRTSTTVELTTAANTHEFGTGERIMLDLDRVYAAIAVLRASAEAHRAEPVAFGPELIVLAEYLNGLLRPAPDACEAKPAVGQSTAIPLLWVRTAVLQRARLIAGVH